MYVSVKLIIAALELNIEYKQWFDQIRQKEPINHQPDQRIQGIAL